MLGLVALICFKAVIIGVQSQDCTSPPDGGANTDKATSCASTQDGNTCTAACLSGWMTMSGQAVVTVACTGGSYDDSLEDCSTGSPCTAPTALPVGVELIYNGGTEHGDVKIYGCMDGYEHDPAIQVVTCNTGSYPSGQPEACTPIDCGPLPSIQGVSASTTTTVYTGNPVTVNCSYGWELVAPSDNEITCTITGEWDPPIWTFCQIQPCRLSLKVPVGVVLVSVGLSQGEYYEIYECLPGYERSPPTQVKACGAGDFLGNYLEACTLIGASDTTTLDTAGASDTVESDTAATSDRIFATEEMIGIFCGGLGLVLAIILGVLFLKKTCRRPANVGLPNRMGNGAMQTISFFPRIFPLANRVWQQRILMNQIRNPQRSRPVMRLNLH